jgi:ribosomal RNA-processing protein 1
MSSMLATDESTITFARALASPDKEIRDKSVHSLIRYVSVLQAITEMEMLKLWKALHYCMWLSDKTTIQMELAEGLSKLLVSFNNDDFALLYFRIFFRTMIREWTLLDQHRINKFYTLIRLMLREGLLFLQRKDWQNDSVDAFLDILEEEVLTKTPNGLRLHLADIFLPELVTITLGEISTDAFTRLLRPFFAAAQGCLDTSFQERVSSKVFRAFARTHAREHRGSMELDGGDVQQLFFNVRTSTVQAMVFEAASDSETAEKNRRRLYLLHQEFPSVTGLAFASMDDEEAVEIEIEIATKVEKKVKVDPAQRNIESSAAIRKDNKKSTAESLTLDVSAETETDSRSAAASPHIDMAKKSKSLFEKDEFPVKKDETSVQKVTKKRKADSTNVAASAPASEIAKSSSHPSSSSDNDTDHMPEAVMISIPSAPARKAEAEAAVAAAPFIASAHFTGEKACYVFRKGKSGQGYYRDELRVKRQAKVPGSKKASLSLTKPAPVTASVATTVISDSQDKKRVKRETADRRKSSDFPPAESVRVDDLTEEGEGEGKGDRKVRFGKPQSKGETGQDSAVCALSLCGVCPELCLCGVLCVSGVCLRAVSEADPCIV